MRGWVWMAGLIVLLGWSAGCGEDAPTCAIPEGFAGVDLTLVDFSVMDLGAALPMRTEGTTIRQSDDIRGASCGRGGVAAEAVFTWTAPATGRYHMDTEGSDYDTLLFVRDGAGAIGSELGCNDDVQRGSLHSRVSLDLEACQTVSIFVDGFEASDRGLVSLRIDGTESICDDGRDDDGDGAIDCDDPDCFGPACSGGTWPAGWEGLEWTMLDEVNARRRAGGTCEEDTFGPAPELEMNETIRSAARTHSEDMGAQDYFDHVSLDGREFDERMSAEGFRGPTPWGENIASGFGAAKGAVDALMRSPGHCRNILNPSYRTIGIGYAYDPTSSLGHYWTQNFAAGH